MKKYIKSMAFFLIAIAVLLIIYFVISGIKGAAGEETYVRRNTEAPAQRVYDYADVLDDDEEEKLEKLIAKREGQIGCDIVLVILNEPLAAYAKAYEDVLGSLSESEYVMVYADNFYDEYAFGYNKPHGDGCVFVDNWDRSDSVYGYAYNWLSTSGRVEDKFSTGMINHVIDDVNDRVNDDPYEAYKSYVNNIYSYMSGKGAAGGFVIPLYAVIIVSAVVAVIYLIANLAGNAGKRTTTSNTYVNGGKANMTVMIDQFIRRSTTQRHIERSSGGGGGGGGHHTSAGGHSHGGGGGHH